MSPKLILLFFSSLALTGLAQNNITENGNDSVIFFKPDQVAYYFDLAGNNQKLFFDSAIYDNSRPITVFIKNNTPNLVQIYPRYHSNTFWKHDNKQYLEPNAYFRAQLIISDTKKFERIGPFIGFLKIEYWDAPNSERKKFELNLKGTVGLGSLPPFKNKTLDEKPKPNAETLPLTIPSIKTDKIDTLSNLGSGKEDLGRNKGKNLTYTFQKLNNQYLTEFTFRRFAETSNLKYRDSIFITEFNRIKNEQKQGVWLASNLSIEEFVNELKRFEKNAVGKPSMANREFIFQYPWEIYQDGKLKATQYYSKFGDIIKRIKYQDLDTIATNYEYKLLIDSNLVNLETPQVIYHNDTITYLNRRNYHTVLVYENAELKQKTSPILQTIQYHSEFPASSGIEDIWIPFTIEKGEFKDLQLYNGTIEYYDKNAKLIRIANVVNQGKRI
jgi:hypothetical protein